MEGLLDRTLIEPASLCAQRHVSPIAQPFKEGEWSLGPRRPTPRAGQNGSAYEKDLLPTINPRS